MRFRDDKSVVDMLFKLATTVPKAGHARLASCIVHRGQVVSWGFNRLKSHPFQARFGKNAQSIYLHSENDAIKNALKCVSVRDLAKSTLYVVRAKLRDANSGQWVMGLAKPCEGCARSIATFNIARTVWSEEGDRYVCS